MEVHVALDRDAGPGYNTLLLRLIPGNLNSTCPIDSSTLPGLLHSRVALPNHYLDACVPSMEAISTIFMITEFPKPLW